VTPCQKQVVAGHSKGHSIAGLSERRRLLATHGGMTLLVMWPPPSAA
jgi:hypothetical protein